MIEYRETLLSKRCEAVCEYSCRETLTFLTHLSTLARVGFLDGSGCILIGRSMLLIAGMKSMARKAAPTKKYVTVATRKGIPRRRTRSGWDCVHGWLKSQVHTDPSMFPLSKRHKTGAEMNLQLDLMSFETRECLCP